jgi:phthalate 4,5-dioxygenase
MLTEEENQLLTRVGPGTPMGELLRRFWLPALLSNELPEPDGDPIRTRHLGEDLIAFRDTNGKVGIVDTLCPHRSAPLFFGRNEESGLRCVYHGWKYDVDGNCVEIPSEPPDSVMKDHISVKAYPTYELAGVVWLYMGPPELRPDRPPELPFTLLRDDQRTGLKFLVESNFLQNLEGELDTAHVSFLHATLNDDSASLNTLIRVEGYNNDRHPRLSIIDTDYGFLYGGRRTRPDGDYYWRVTQYLLPIYGLIPRSGGYLGGATIWVPIDDYTCWRFLIGGVAEMGALNGNGPQASGLPPMTIERGTYSFGDGTVIDTMISKDNKSNLYGMDRKKQRTVNYTGMTAIPTQDQAMNEGMGAIVDRSREHLAPTDVAIIRMRSLLTKLVTDLQNGIEPTAPHRPEMYRVRSLDVDAAFAELTELVEHFSDDMRIEEGEPVF